MGVIDDLILSVITPLEGGLGRRLRYHYYKGKLRKCDGYFVSESGFRILGCEHVSIGKRCGFNRNVFISATNNIAIGDDVIVGAFSLLRDSDHGHELKAQGSRLKAFKDQPLEIGSIDIGSNVWIAAHCCILKGSVVGCNTVVGANSVVRSNLDSGGVWVGSPVRRVN